jgi:predicted dehydrogenase
MATEKQISVVLLGAGFIGQMHALSVRLSKFALGGGKVRPLLRCLIETPANEETARQTAERFGFDELSVQHWSHVLTSTECDLLVNAGPNKTHVDPSICFARAGKHVFCEKPLAGTADESFRAWEGVASQGVKHMCAFVHRFIPAIQLARNIIRTGEIGQILQYRSQFLLDMRNPDGSLSWRFNRTEAGGGATGDLGSHHIDVARFLVGEIEEIGAYVKTVTKDPAGQATINDDSFVAIASLENGALATFEASRVAGGHALTGRIEIDGTRGSIGFDMERLNELRISMDRSGWKTFLVTGPDHPYADFFLPVGIQGAHPISWRDCFVFQMHHMLKAIERDENVEPIGATFEDGYKVAEIVDTMLTSAREKSAQEIHYRQFSQPREE